MKLFLIGSGVFLLIIAALLWIARQLYLRRIERCYADLLQLHHMMRRLPHGHMPSISFEEACARVQDYDDVVSSGLYPNDRMLSVLRNQCSWLHNPEQFRIIFPSS